MMQVVLLQIHLQESFPDAQVWQPEIKDLLSGTTKFSNVVHGTATPVQTKAIQCLKANPLVYVSVNSKAALVVKYLVVTRGRNQKPGITALILMDSEKFRAVSW